MRNSSDLNPKQQELVKKLEKIRQQRTEEGTSKNKENKSVNPSQTDRRYEQRRQRNRRKTDQSEFNYGQLKPSETKKRANQKPISSNKKTKKNNKLLQQLTNENNLAQAMILNEILSKPVALRGQKR